MLAKTHNSSKSLLESARCSDLAVTVVDCSAAACMIV